MAPLKKDRAQRCHQLHPMNAYYDQKAVNLCMQPTQIQEREKYIQDTKEPKTHIKTGEYPTAAPRDCTIRQWLPAFLKGKGDNCLNSKRHVSFCTEHWWKPKAAISVCKPHFFPTWYSLITTHPRPHALPEDSQNFRPRRLIHPLYGVQKGCPNLQGEIEAAICSNIYLNTSFPKLKWDHSHPGSHLTTHIYSSPSPKITSLFQLCWLLHLRQLNSIFLIMEGSIPGQISTDWKEQRFVKRILPILLGMSLL